LAKRIDDSFGLKTAKKEKYYARKDSKTQPPVEAPYVPPKTTRSIKSQDRTVDIFEGMTLVELAKRTGESIRRLQDILLNVGEKAGSEFDSLSIDVAELVAMVCACALILLIQFIICFFERLSASHMETLG